MTAMIAFSGASTIGGVPSWTLGGLGLLVVAALPVWPWSRGWGWAPAGMLAMGLVTFVVFSLSVAAE